MALSPRDHMVVCNWAASKASLAHVEGLPRSGLVGNERFTEAARRRYVWLWNWSAHRFTGQIGMAQDRFYKLHGMTGLVRRISRVRRCCAVYGLHLGPLP